LEGVREAALADLYVTLQDLTSLYYEARLLSQAGPKASQSLRAAAASSSGRALADYLFAHPDRCDETLRSLGGEFAVGEKADVFKKPTPKPTLSDFTEVPVFKASGSGGATNERLSRKG